MSGVCSVAVSICAVDCDGYVNSMSSSPFEVHPTLRSVEEDSTFLHFGRGRDFYISVVRFQQTKGVCGGISDSNVLQVVLEVHAGTVVSSRTKNIEEVDANLLLLPGIANADAADLEDLFRLLLNREEEVGHVQLLVRVVLHLNPGVGMIPRHPLPGDEVLVELDTLFEGEVDHPITQKSMRLDGSSFHCTFFAAM